MSSDISIVEYYSDNSGYRCGYCKSPDTNYSHGMWAHELTVQDYQDLVDRGWRRSGCYCYKPIMHLTCCPMYTIKCSVLDFKLSKSQKKKLKRFHNFLAFGKKQGDNMLRTSNESSSDMDSGDDMVPDTCTLNDVPDLKQKAERASVSEAVINSVEDTFYERLGAHNNEVKLQGGHSPKPSSVPTSSQTPFLEEKTNMSSKDQLKSVAKKSTRPGEGPDPSRPLCKKAKFLRLERKEKRLAQLDPTSRTVAQKTKTTPTPKTIDDFIYEPLPDSPAHRLEIRLVRSSPVSKEFESTFKAVLELYQRYQTSVHNDPVEKVGERQFTRFLVNSPLKIKLVNVQSKEMVNTLNTSWALFEKYQMAIHKEEKNECDISTYNSFLVDSPLKPCKPKEGPPQGYGSFHQQYWLDDRLIAVGVIDILPSCISSVYFFYDPEFHFLVLGTYGSLREIAFCRTLHHRAPSLRYYYMGFYIHSCPKMRYKGAYSPSFLLCPETYEWFPIERCLALLQQNKYCRFNSDASAKDRESVTNIRDVSVLFSNKAMRFHVFLALNQSSSHQAEVKEYANLVGDKLSKRILLLLT